MDTILTTSNNQSAKIVSLKILEDLIKYRWKGLPRDQANAIRAFVVDVIIRLSRDAETLKREKLLVQKLNLILVQVVKQEWPHNWGTFIADMVSSAKTSMSLCENNMQILKLLSEEVFDFSGDQMTSTKTQELKQSFNKDFGMVFELCSSVLSSDNCTESLYVSTLETLLRFLNWIPVGYIFQTKLVELLTGRFLVYPGFRNLATKCLAEIVAIKAEGVDPACCVALYASFMKSLAAILPDSVNIADVYGKSGENDQQFVSNLALFLIAAFTSHLSELEPAVFDAVLKGHEVLCKITFVNDKEVFKCCVEYWLRFAQQLYNESPVKASAVLNIATRKTPRNQAYSPVLNFVRVAVIEKMAKPEEVLLVENDNGEVVREFSTDTEVTALYAIMKDCLVYLTHLDYEATENLMLERLAVQVDGREWDRKKLNTICWAIGSISGAMKEEDEKKLVITVIKGLLELVEKKHGKDNKAAIAGNIMYVCGQYPRFLRAHWKFLKTVANKLFEFMHEKHPGVQDMACDTFMKLATKCRRKFVTVNPGESRSFIEVILGTLDKIVADLEPQQVASVYRALGVIITAHSDPNVRAALVRRLMAYPNQTWREIVAVAKLGLEPLQQLDVQRRLVNTLRCNVAACAALENSYLVQLQQIYQEMITFYKIYAVAIAELVAKGDCYATRTVAVKTMRSIKQEILRLMDTFIAKCMSPSDVYTMFVPTLLTAILGDYKQSVPDARDPQVLALVTTTIRKMKGIMANDIPGIFACVFGETLAMITKNFEDFPEHRVHFYAMLQSIIEYCFDSLFRLSGEQFRLVYDAIVWAFKHTEHNVSETGLKTLLSLLRGISQSPQVAAQFYPVYYAPTVQDIFAVLTDSQHKFGFKLQTDILAHLIHVAKVLPVPLSQNQTVPNQQFVAEFIFKMLAAAFTSKKPEELQHYVVAMLSDAGDLQTVVRDLVITLKEFGGDNTELYRDGDDEARRREAERVQRMQVPGMVKPADLPGED